MQWNRPLLRVAGSLAAAALLAALAGVSVNQRGARAAADGPAVVSSPAASAPSAKKGDGDPAKRRAALQDYADLAGVSVAQFRQAIQDHGGKAPVALASFNIPYDRLVSFFTDLETARLAPAVDDGRLTTDQANQLAMRQVARDLRRAGVATPKSGRSRGEDSSGDLMP